MPADTSKPLRSDTSSASRRTSRKISTEEDIELKRARGEISCAECRRLKLKCDKKLPCSSCVRRGCPTICPNGSLATGQGTRFVLADTEQLHRKIAEMGQRIRQLEDAVAIFQAGVSSEIHPLLSEDLLAIKYGPEAPKSTPASGDHISVPIDALGTLTIGDGGASKYFGRSAGSETLFLAGAELGSQWQPDDLPEVSPDIARLSAILPFGLTGFGDSEKTDQVLDSLFVLLPSYPRATTLLETYIEQAAWIFRPIRRDELINDILTPIYAAAKARADDSAEPKPEIPPHMLSVLYLVFAHGALMDLTLPPHNSEAENYFQLGRLALSLRSVFDVPTTYTLQALALMGYYHSNGGRRYTIDAAWSALSIANKLGQSVNRDPARFGMDPQTVQRRRTLFWELFSADMFHSLALGRPPSIRLSYTDCEFPEDETTRLTDKGEIEMGFWRWKHTFTRDVFTNVLETTLTAAPPSYETILELDRKVREKVLPLSLNLYRSNTTEQFSTPSAYMRGRLLFQFRTTTMLYIHRSFFAQAMLDHPTNPLCSPYAPSFLAAYRCASVIIKTTVCNFQQFPDLFSRWWTMWNHLFSAAIIVGTIVTRAPSSTMAPAALIELDLAVDLFSRGSTQSPRAAHGMAILSKLKTKAYQVYSSFRSGSSLVPSPSALLPEIGGEDELALFGGQTRILVSKILSQKDRRRKQTASTSTPSSETPQSPASTPATQSDEGHSPASSDHIPDIHPSLMDYLSTLPPPSATPTVQNGATPDFSQFLSLQSSQFNMQVDEPYPNSAAASASTSPFAQSPVNTLFDESFMPVYSGANMFESSSRATENPVSSTDFGLMMGGESGMDEQWMSFMRESGILDGHFKFNQTSINT
ncbi:fungal-specific transcription factor domain-containing protein [Hygrophoropsis aurantiaca]|uniref:Fungal-specific transcription factor domain-containing protein n=1 Tax=Hygrophoropsis aurantiaca TaxID=72124 RepID=A0ACB8ATC3_9AGAM|nr:fungal-specific transcription factor domain-containing protein [Hygrophoropsis aurantiaca]